ncbi:MAG: ABC transporter permease [Blautia sp.]|nr:ABC transporter permease [Blautia sp.]
MGRYICKRLLQAILVIFLISVFSYFLMYLVPGDPVYAVLGSDITREQYMEQFYLMELDKPIIIRYVHWLTRFLTGDFGTSYRYSVPVSELLAQRLPITMYLGIISLVISVILGVLCGTICGTNRGKAADNILTVLANLGSVVPGFWLAVVGMYIFSMNLGWLPSYGFAFPWEGAGVAASLKQTIMPVVCLSVGSIAGLTRQMRSGMLEVIRQDYIRTARSKGLKESTVVVHHAMKNAIIPVVTIIGLSLRNIVSGAVTIETVFSITGMGSLLVNSILARDLPVIQACILIIAGMVAISNLVVDICYGYLDPRIRIQ